MYSLFEFVDDSRAYCANDTVTKYCFVWNVFSSHNSLQCLKERGPGAKTSPLLLWLILVSFMEKGPCTNVLVFCPVFTKLGSYKVFLKVTPPQIHNIFHHCFSLHISVNFVEKNPHQSFMVFLTILYKFMKLQNFEQ